MNGRQYSSSTAVVAGTGILVYGVGLAVICIGMPNADLYNQTTAHGAVMFAGFGAMLLVGGTLSRP